MLLQRQALSAVRLGGGSHERRGSLVRRGKGGRRREIGMDTWGWEQLTPTVHSRRARMMSATAGLRL
jgi:hypothetical protein